MVWFNCFASLETNGDGFALNFFFIVLLFIYLLCVHVCLFTWGGTCDSAHVGVRGRPVGVWLSFSTMWEWDVTLRLLALLADTFTF